MPSWTTHEIELLISEIAERQCDRNIFSPEYKARAKNQLPWKEVWGVLDRDQIEVSVCSLFANQ